MRKNSPQNTYARDYMHTQKWTAKAKEGVKSWDRVRFFANDSDYRTVVWPPLGPYWCSGYCGDRSVVVAYVPHGTTDSQLNKFWPESEKIDRMQEGVNIEFSDRFPRPSWWID